MPSSLPQIELRQAQNLIEMLRNDMRSTFESKCHKHGSPHGTTSNMTMALLPMIGVELVAGLSRGSTEGKNAAIRRVMTEIASMSGVAPYATLGYPLWFAYRNGLAHTFYPSQITLQAPDSGGTIQTYSVGTTPFVHILDLQSMTPCVDETVRADYNDHMTLGMRSSTERWLQVSAQALFMDIDSYMLAFHGRIETDLTLQPLVIANRQRMEAEGIEASKKWLNAADRAALQIP